MTRQKNIPPANRAAVQERSGGVCEACGRTRAVTIHHRQYRSRGGSHDVHNLIAVCGFGNTSGCHGVAHTGEGETYGWSVPSWARPELWPAWRWDVRSWVIYYDQPDSKDRWWSEITETTAQMLMKGGTE